MTAEEIINIIKEDYMSCPNVSNDGTRVLCGTWYRHDDCVRIMNLLNRITKDDKYSIPPVRQEVSKAIEEMINDPKTSEILRKLEDNGI